MKKKNIFIALGLLVMSLTATTSCDDMLTVDTGDKTYVNANDTLYSYLGIMKCVQNLAERQVILNEVRGDLTASTEYVTDTLHAISNFEDPKDGSCTMLNISDYYEVINNCNLYIANADTAKVKANVKYMLPEYAQVQAVRAWTYLQMVNIYGEVPFIVEPIHNLDVIKNFDYANNQVNKDNLIDKFLELGITRYVDTEYPSYGNYNNGATNISSRLLFIPVRLVIADMYLLRGASQADYRNAAQYYYDYLRATNSVLPQQFCTANQLMGNEYSHGSRGWGSYAGTYSYTSQGEVISLIPSSANKQFGTMLTRVADIFGYTPTSSQKNETSTNEEGTEESESSGAISVTRNYKAQIVPSNGYTALNKAQMYVYWNTTNLNRTFFEEAGDARMFWSVEDFTYEGQSYTLASKAARGASFYYSVPIYRKTLVWLRLAEAINRAGYPQIAFAVLKDGLNGDNWPEVAEVEVPVPQVDGEGNPLTDEEGNILYVTDEEGNQVTQTQEVIRYDNYGAMNYVDRDEFENFFLDFSDEMWLNNYGIHARGCGYGPLVASQATTGRSVKTFITGNYDDTYFDWKPMMEKQGIDLESATKDDVINAVENIICDELALELAFEGYRFSDLVRMANHKNASGYQGTEWLAAKIADRNARKASEDGTVTEITRDEALYTKLHDQRLWYLTKPEWAVK